MLTKILNAREGETDGQTDRETVRERRERKLLTIS